jgi:N4-(beta-N-acetylglucosaminyl)-L-asparaginase
MDQHAGSLPSVRDPASHAAGSAAAPAISRRTLLGAGAALSVLPSAAPAVLVRRKGGPVMIGSSNALRGMQTYWPRLEQGAEPLDVALEVVKTVEADPEDSSVGLGGLPNERGVVQLDAACMHGPTHSSGAVACLENILHPCEVARLVMERTDHSLLVGPGAYEFARLHGHPHVELLTDKAREAWLRWKENLSTEDEWLPPKGERRTGMAPRRESARTAAVREVLGDAAVEHLWGTVHCSARGANGDLACTTTTSGLAFKIPGRVGDSPIIGAGLYCDQAAGSAGSTGRGEAAILANGSFAIVELLRQGRAPKDAGIEVLRRIVQQTEKQAPRRPHLLGADGKPSFAIEFYVLAPDGSFAGVRSSGESRGFAVADADGGARLEPLEVLLG